MGAWLMMIVVVVVAVAAASRLPRLARRVEEAQKDIKHGGLTAEMDDA